MWILQDRVPADIARRHKGTLITIKLAGEPKSVTIGDQIKLSLSTSDKDTAKERHRDATAQLSEAYERLRQAQAQGPVRLTERQCQEIAGDYFRQTKAQHEADPGDSEGWDAARSAVIDQGQTLAGQEAMHGNAADALLQARGLIPTAESRGRLLAAMQGAFLDAMERIEKWAEGDFAHMTGGDSRYPQPSATPAITRKPALTLGDVRDRWIKEHRAQGKSEQTVRMLEKQFGILVQFLGGNDDRDATTVTADDIDGWVASLEDKGLSRKTIGDSHFALIKAAFNLSRRKLPKWPFDGVRVKIPRKARVRPPGFTEDEAKAILRAAKNGLGVGPRMKEHTVRALRWVPWICAYTGGRVGEIIQLRTQDFKQERGINYIQITGAAGTNKTDNYRDVPLHSHLIEEGLLEMIQGLPTGHVFLTTTSDKADRSKINVVTKDIGRWVRTQVGITDTNLQPNHGWRHRLITEARRWDIREETQEAITGHEDGKASRGYGEVPLETLAAAIAKIPRIDITTDAATGSPEAV